LRTVGSAVGGRRKSEKSMEVLFILLYASTDRGKTSVVTKYLQMVEMPEALVRPETTIGLWINKKCYWFKNKQIFWSTKTGCVIEMVWPKADDIDFLKEIQHDKSWRQSSPDWQERTIEQS
jgi:hypothetical protein